MKELGSIPKTQIPPSLPCPKTPPRISQDTLTQGIHGVCCRDHLEGGISPSSVPATGVP